MAALLGGGESGDVAVESGLREGDGSEKSGRNSRVFTTMVTVMVMARVAETGTCCCCSCSHGVVAADEFSTEK